MANMFKSIKDWSRKKKILAVVIVAAIVIAVCGISFAGCHKTQPIKASQQHESAAVFDDNIRHYRDGKKTTKATAKATASPAASASASSEAKPDDSKSEKPAENKETATQSNSQTPAKQPTVSVPIGNKPATKNNSSKSTSKSCKVVHHDATGHNEDITEQKWVQDSGAWDETVVDQDAWDEKVVDKPASQHTVLTYHCNNCSYTTQDMAAADNHMNSTGHLAYYYDEQWVTDPEVSHTVHHDAVTHVVHHDATGHYETVVTGQKWVVDSGAWDETVCD